MDGMLSQEEINALLNDTGGSGINLEEDFLTPEEMDAIGEISNITRSYQLTIIHIHMHTLRV